MDDGRNMRPFFVFRFSFFVFRFPFSVFCFHEALALSRWANFCRNFATFGATTNAQYP